jgi:hypothetical protein
MMILLALVSLCTTAKRACLHTNWRELLDVMNRESGHASQGLCIHQTTNGIERGKHRAPKLAMIRFIGSVESGHVDEHLTYARHRITTYNAKDLHPYHICVYCVQPDCRV